MAPVLIKMESIKDKVIFCTKDDVTSKYELPPPLPGEEKRGILLPNGELNWTCPCLGGLPYGPCGFEFREFFGCLHKTQEIDTKNAQEIGDATKAAQEAETTKAQECFPKFAAMKECFSHFPKLYPPNDEEDDL